MEKLSLKLILLFLGTSSDMNHFLNSKTLVQNQRIEDSDVALKAIPSISQKLSHPPTHYFCAAIYFWQLFLPWNFGGLMVYTPISYLLWAVNGIKGSVLLWKTQQPLKHRFN